MTDYSFQRSIPSQWELLETIRGEVRERTAELGNEIMEACVMVASELVENAIKYGERTADCPHAIFLFECRDGFVRISVANGLCSVDKYNELREHIDAVAASQDKMALYIKRFTELLENAETSVRLGLYRISAEAGFELACEHRDNVLKVSAFRRVDDAFPM